MVPKAVRLTCASVDIVGEAPHSHRAEPASLCHLETSSYVDRYGHLSTHKSWSVRGRLGHWAGAHARSWRTCM